MDGKKYADEIAFFSEYVSKHKKELFRHILEYRTRFFTVVLEDIYQAQNTSAVLRSCDGFGIQNVYVIENKNRFDIDRGVTIGADKWLTVHRFNKPNSHNTDAAYRHLRDKGYRIVATTPHVKQICLSDFLPESPTALVFGSEKAGLSNFAVDEADERLFIPMHGLSESFNISVCVAICLYHIRQIMDKSGLPWQIPDDQKDIIYLDWLRKSVRHLKALDRKFKELQQDS